MSQLRTVRETPSTSWHTVEEGELLRACIEDRNTKAFNELFRRYRSEAYRTIYLFIKGSEETDDVLQEVFIEVFRSLHRFQGRSRFSTWLYRVCVNVSMRHLRKRRPQPMDLSEMGWEYAVAPERDRPDEALERKTLLHRLKTALDGLSDKKRMVFILHDIQGVPAKEIAAIVEAPVLTVRTRLFYARKEIMAQVGDDLMGSFRQPPSGGKK